MPLRSGWRTLPCDRSGNVSRDNFRAIRQVFDTRRVGGGGGGDETYRAKAVAGRGYDLSPDMNHILGARLRVRCTWLGDNLGGSYDYDSTSDTNPFD